MKLLNNDGEHYVSNVLMKKIILSLLFCISVIFSFAQTDAKVSGIYALGKIPSPLGIYNYTVKARIKNAGSLPLTNLPVFLSVTGANSFQDTKSVNIAAGDSVIVYFSQFSPWNIGTNTLTVSVPADDNNTNNSAVYTQEITTNTFANTNNGPALNSRGFGITSGILYNEYTIMGSALVTQVKVHISNQSSNIGKTIYGVVNKDGVISQSAAHVISAAELNTYVTLDITNPVVLANDASSQLGTIYFLAGVLQTIGIPGYNPVSYQDGYGSYYTSATDGSNLTEVADNGRLMIDAVVEVGNVPPFPNITPKAYYSIATWDFTGIHSPSSVAATYFNSVLNAAPILQRGPGAPAYPATNAFFTNGFGNNGIAVTNTDYYQVNINPKPGDTISFTTIKASVGNDSSQVNISSQFAYSIDGNNFTLIGSPQVTTNTYGFISFDLSSIPALQNVLNNTTVSFRYYASGPEAVNKWGFNTNPNLIPGLDIQGAVRTSILTAPVVPTGADFTLPDCNTSFPSSISFTSTGTFAPGNVYSVELGNLEEPHQHFFQFLYPVVVGTLASNANSGTINFTIPEGMGGGQYAVRVTGSNPPTTGTFSQAFIINNPTYCISSPGNYFRSRASGNWNDINTWESSYDHNSWIPATATPGMLSPEVQILNGHTVTITSSIATINTLVMGTLKLLHGNGDNGDITLTRYFNPFSTPMTIDTSGTFQIVSSDAVYQNVIHYEAMYGIRVSGRILIGDGVTPIAAGFDAFATGLDPVFWYNGSVFEWNVIAGASPRSDANYFDPESAWHPTFRLTNIPGGSIGSADSMAVNGILEVNTPVTWTGTGKKTFRDGIIGSSTVTQAPGSGKFFTTSSFAIIPSSDSTVSTERGVIDGNINVILSQDSGYTLLEGISIPENARVTISGKCISRDSIAISQGAEVTVTDTLFFDNANLINDGLLNGAGVVQFIGDQPSFITSRGTMLAHLSILNKELHLGGNSHTNSIELSNESNLVLDSFNLDMGAAGLVADSANFIVTNDTGRLIRYVTTTPVLFPVGINDTSYTPVTMSNAGTADNIKVRVKQGVKVSVPVTIGNVDRTWMIGDTTQTGPDLDLTMQWRAVDEQTGFNRDYCRIAHISVCPPPVNCDVGFFDASPANSATGTSYFSVQRSGNINFWSTGFVVTSTPFTLRFTGVGNWNNINNWTPGIVPSLPITSGTEIIIDGFGPCNFTGDIIVEHGAKLTVQPGKILNVIGNIIVE